MDQRILPNLQEIFKNLCIVLMLRESLGRMADHFTFSKRICEKNYYGVEIALKKEINNLHAFIMQ